MISTPDAILVDLTRPYGVLASPDDSNCHPLLIEALRRNAETLSYVNSQQSLFPPGDVLHGIVHNSQLNAFACTSRGHDVVCVFSQLYLLFRTVAAAFVSSSEAVAEGLGVRGTCASPIALQLHLRKAATKGHAGFGEFYPSNREGAVLYELLASLMESFVFLHELGHIVNAHLDATARNAASTPHIRLEHGATQCCPHNLEYEQCLEFDADDWATRSLMRLVFSSSADLCASLGPGKRVPEDARLYALGASQLICFLVLDLFNNETSLVSSSSHPVPAVRSAYAYLISYLIAHNSDPTFAKKYWGYYSLALDDVTRFWNQCQMPARTHSHARSFGELLEVAKTWRAKVWTVKKDNLWTHIDARNARLGTTERLRDDGLV